MEKNLIEISSDMKKTTTSRFIPTEDRLRQIFDKITDRLGSIDSSMQYTKVPWEEIINKSVTTKDNIDIGDMDTVRFSSEL